MFRRIRDAAQAPTDSGTGTGVVADPPTKTDPPQEPVKEPPVEAVKEPTKEPPKEPEAPKAPEKYELALPEGDRLEAADLATIETIARAKGWTNAQAQQAINEHAAALDTQSDAFLSETTRDTEYGGEKLADTQKLAKAALDKVRPAGTPRGDAIRRLLNRTGYGNHIEIVSLLADLGKLMAEDSPSQQSGGSHQTKDAASVLYG